MATSHCGTMYYTYASCKYVKYRGCSLRTGHRDAGDGDARRPTAQTRVTGHYTPWRRSGGRFFTSPLRPGEERTRQRFLLLGY